MAGTKTQAGKKTGSNSLGSFERRQHWTYNGLLGRVAMARSGAQAVQKHSMTSGEAKFLATELEHLCNKLYKCLQETKVKQDG